jgi:hypothetical protein
LTDCRRIKLASLRTMHTVKPGMTRTDLLKVFKTKGGISN